MVVEHLGTNNHADEIVSTPTTHDTLPQLPVNGAIPHNMNQSASPDRLRHALDALGIPNGYDDGRLYTIIPTGERENDLVFWIMLQGKERQIVQMVCQFNVKIPRRKWPIALTLCNTYHAESRFGRAVLYIRDGQDEATLSFEGAVNCADGVSQEFLQTLISSHIASTAMFYDMVRNAKGLTLPRPKKASKTTHTKEVTSQK